MSHVQYTECEMAMPNVFRQAVAVFVMLRYKAQVTTFPPNRKMEWQILSSGSFVASGSEIVSGT